MFAARVDQENAVHARQTAAAAKPLNHGVQGLTAKTPGNRAPKTPFKASLRDENEVVKTIGKTNGKELGGKQQGGKPEQNLFQTPAPRERQALGFKTTNAKAAAFQTPAAKALGPSPEKTQRRTVGRSRLQIHKEVTEAEPEIDWGQEEIQYIPPRPQPLEDVPSDDERDKVDFSILKTGNFAGGAVLESAARAYRRFEAEDALAQREALAKLNRDTDDSVRQILADLTENPDGAGSRPRAALGKPSREKGKPVSSIAARSAAAALARPAKVPSYAAPTVAARAKMPSSLLGSRKEEAGGHGRHNRAVSQSTLGYARGRAVSNTIRPVFRDQASDGSEAPRKKQGEEKKDAFKELQERVARMEAERLGIEEAELLDDGEAGKGGVPILGMDGEEELVQLKMPEEIGAGD